jgi:Family of unknown function (DUF5686)/CarboxypepD_reg-like domain
MKLNMKIGPFLLLLILLAAPAFAGGIRGTVKADDGSPLPFATIYIKQTGTGSASDTNGRYEVALSPGRYDIYYQFLGYETATRVVDVGDGFQEINITLKSQVVQLQSVTIHASKEDPAYSVMRRAIAKAKYHTQQVDSFFAKVYIKGKGKLKDYPWVAKKLMEKEGITKDRLFIQESVSEIQYKRPNKFKEKVIAIYTQGKNNNTSPNEYIFGSLYEPEIAETISPLSPKAFSYYKFEYLGSFRDRNIEINKIKVTPRSKGDNVFDGVIYIVEDFWSIHSVDLNSTKMGVKFHISQIYNPIEDAKKIGQAWMPVTQNFKVNGSVFGFEFEGQYLATVKDYKLFLNPALKHEITVVDEKKVEPLAVVPKSTKTQKATVVQQKLAEGKQVTNKELNQLIKQYEKEEQKKQPEPAVLSDRSFKVDSTARKKDSVFWADIRPAPLEKEEVRGYVKADSFAIIEKKREEGDSLKGSKSKGFQPWDLLMGDRYKLGKTSDFEIHTPYGGFNTVEGFNIIYRMSLYKRWVKRDSLKPEMRPRVTRLEITPVLRYSFEREKLIGFLRADWRSTKSRITLESGRYVTQYNQGNPIHHFVNTFTSLLWGDNLMKIYERDFTDLSFRYRFNDRLTLFSAWSYSHRRELFNNTTYTFFKGNKDSYTVNGPVNNELSNTSFPTHQAFTGMARLEMRPWVKYRIRNGFKQRVDGSSPLFSLEYRKGFNGIGGSDVDYDLLDLGIRYGVKFGIRGRLDANVHVGAFLNDRSLYFMDFKHFQGNRTPIITTDPDGSYRLLDYYTNSTSDKYLNAIVHYHFRKLLVSRIPKLRLLGIQENAFVSVLTTPASGTYHELGYSIDGILRIFRVEGAASFQNGKYMGYGFRIGIASGITATFGD